jgi:hypothetical protein
MAYITDPRVDAYIQALPDWQQAICREVRDLVHGADEEVTETIKRTDRPYFVLQGNICALLAAKDHVNVFLYDGAIVPDPEGAGAARPRRRPGDRSSLCRHGLHLGGSRMSGRVPAGVSTRRQAAREWFSTLSRMRS